MRCRQCMTQERGILEQEPRLPPLKYDAEQPDIDDSSESEELVQYGPSSSSGRKPPGKPPTCQNVKC